MDSKMKIRLTIEQMQTKIRSSLGKSNYISNSLGDLDSMKLDAVIIHLKEAVAIGEELVEIIKAKKEKDNME